MEVGYGTNGKPCGYGSSHASCDGNLPGDPADHWPAHASRRFCRVPIPRRSLGLGIGHVMDLGTFGTSGCVAWARGGTRGPSLGRRRYIGSAASFVSVVVMSKSPCECRSSFLPATRRKLLAVCSPTCPQISSRKSSLSIAIRLMEPPISPKRWERESFRSLAEDTGVLV